MTFKTRRSIGARAVLSCVLGLAELYLQPSAADAEAPAFPCSVELGAGAPSGDSIRQALSRELAVTVIEAEPSALAQRAHLEIEGDAADSIRITFVRADASRVQRSLVVARLGDEATETLALVAANLTRDEAAELLATLQASAPVQAGAAPQPTAANTAPPAAPTPPPTRPLHSGPSGCELHLPERIPFGIDLAPGLGASSVGGKRIERATSLNLIGGLTGIVHGFELGGVINLDMVATCGVQVSGVINITKGPVEGLQLGQINLASQRLDGVQFGMINFAGRETDGAQLGLVNFTRDTVHGAQLGLVNVAARDVHGLQLGLVNAGARDVHGLQLGLVNFASDSDESIGLVSVVAHGRTQLDVWGTDAGLLMVGVEHGGRRFHNIYGVGISARDRQPLLAAAYGLGVRVATPGDFFVDVDAIAYGLFIHDSARRRFDTSTIAQLRVPIGWQLTAAVSVFLAPSLNVSVADADRNLLAAPDLFGSRRLSHSGASTSVRMWPGLSVGARFF
jgi:hypothetical protein